MSRKTEGLLSVRRLTAPKDNRPNIHSIGYEANFYKSWDRIADNRGTRQNSCPPWVILTTFNWFEL